MTTHSQTHNSFDGKTVAWQRNELKTSNDMIESVTGKRPTSFITPFNEYDTNTPVSMLLEGVSVMSASCTWDPVTYDPIYCMEGSDVVAPDIMWNGVYSLPAGAVLGKEAYWTNYNLPASLADATGWIDAQIGK
jgi:peptidoglycan/xylan/chitin deacetylase (PgdA/CDA1 family)